MLKRYQVLNYSMFIKTTIAVSQIKRTITKLIIFYKNKLGNAKNNINKVLLQGQKRNF